MPRFISDHETLSAPSGTFKFSGVAVAKLGATRFTLVELLVDKSQSVEPFQADMEECMRTAVAACKLNPQCENVLMRTSVFDHVVTELVGYTPVTRYDTKVFDGCLSDGGSTALYRGWEQSAEAGTGYATQLVDADYEVNNLTIIGITDGLNNNDPDTADGVRERLKAYASHERLGSITTVLVGVNDEDKAMWRGQVRLIRDVLEEFKAEAGLTQYIGLGDVQGDAGKKKLARLANFISRSISSASRAVAGQPAPTTTF